MNTEEFDRGRLVAAHEDAAEFYRGMLLGPEGAGPRRYLIERGFGALLDQTPWTVGYAPPGRTRLRDHLTDLGYSDQTLLAAGLTRTSRRGTTIDCFRDRLTLGIRDSDGALVGFTARCSPDAPAHVPKYVNTTTTAIYDKSRLLFGLGEATRASADRIVITEGPLDAIAVQLADNTDGRHPPALALCGTAITEKHRKILAALRPQEIVLALDPDEAGARAREHAYKLLRGIADITAIDSRDAADLAETLHQDGPTAVTHLLNYPRPAIDAIIDARLATWPNRSENAEAGVACLRSIARLLNDLKPPDMAHSAAQVRESTRLPIGTVTRELAEAVTPVTPSAGPY